MINCNKGEVRVTGHDNTIAAEFCIIALAMLESKVLDKGLMNMLIEEVQKTYEEDSGSNNVEMKIDLKELKKQVEEENERNGQNQDIQE